MTEQVTLTVVPGGVGPAIATSQLQAKKTVVVGGASGSVDVQASGDGVNWCSVHTFTGNGNQDVVIEVNAAFMRVDASNGGASAVWIMAERGLMRSGVIPVPPSNGPGASLDITDFGCKTTVFCGDPGSGSVGIEISNNDVDWYTAFKTFTAEGCDTKEISARYIRAVGQGGSSSLSVSSEEPAVSAIIAPNADICWVPEDPLGDRGNIYTTWAGAYAAARSIPCGFRRIFVDCRFSSLTADGFNAAMVTANPENGGVWDMDRIVITNDGSVDNNAIIFEDTDNGSANAYWSKFFFCEGNRLRIIHDGVQHSPIIGDAEGFAMTGNRTEIYNTNPAALPLIKVDAARPFWFVTQNGKNIGGTIGKNGVTCPAPVIDSNGVFFILGQGPAGCQDNALTDSVGTSIFWLRKQDSAGFGGRNGRFTWSFPAIPATSVWFWTNVPHHAYQIGTNLRTGGPNPVTAADSPLQANYNQLLRVDTTGGPVTILLPNANPAFGESIVIVDVANNAGVTPITVTPLASNPRNPAAAGDAIMALAPGASDSIAVNGGSGVYVPDGVGGWSRH